MFDKFVKTCYSVGLTNEMSEKLSHVNAIKQYQGSSLKLYYLQMKSLDE